MNAPLDVQRIRSLFPALSGDPTGPAPAFFDGPAGSQVPQAVADAVTAYLLETNANTHGAFSTSIATDAMLHQARHAVAEFLGTSDPERHADSIIFGQNMTSLTFALSRSLSRRWSAGDEIVVTRLDHDANITPWVLAARDCGARVRYVNFRHDDCTLDLDQLEQVLSAKTQLVAVGAAANSAGTINPIGQITRMAHEQGAEVFVDAVHYAPHAPIDVAAWDCDYLSCSAYKFFGPHVGILWGKPDKLASLPSYQVRPAGDQLPDRLTVGTQNLEGIAGTLAAIHYLAYLGQPPQQGSRRDALLASYQQIAEHEYSLLAHLLSELNANPAIQVYGIRDLERLRERCPTVVFKHERVTPGKVARTMAEKGIHVWSGNFYAVAMTEALGLEPDGLVRVGILHYNTMEEIHRLVTVLDAL